MDRAEDAVVELIDDLEQAKKAGVDRGQAEAGLELQRKAQWRVDFVNAENSMGFHAPQEAARILGEAIDYARQGQVALRDLGAPRWPGNSQKEGRRRAGAPALLLSYGTA